MENVLILGSRGMLGGELKKVFPNAAAWDRDDCDVTDFVNLSTKIESIKNLDAVINCVAYNDVDGAETNREIAFKLNSDVPSNLAKICKQLDVPLVNFTSQLVFDGIKGEYVETDVPHPISVYGESKYSGEREIQKNTDKFYIIRTSVLFGPKGDSVFSKKSFVDLMLDKSSGSATIKAVSDEESSVTYSGDLALSVREILRKLPHYGIYHVTNSGSASWYDLAKEIFAITGKDINLVPVLSGEFPRLAKRPAKAVLLNTKLPLLRPWQEALREFLTTI